MNKDQLLDYISCGREIEFKYDGKMYSITYGIIDDKQVISFCEFDKETTEVENAEDILHVSRNGITVQTMLQSIDKENIWIY